MQWLNLVIIFRGHLSISVLANADIIDFDTSQPLLLIDSPAEGAIYSSDTASVVYKRSPLDKDEDGCGIGFSKNRPVFTGSSRFAEVLVTDPEDGNSQMTSNHIHFVIRPPPPIESPSICSPPPPFVPPALLPPTPCNPNINLSACTPPPSPPPPSFCACLNLTARSSPAFLVDSFTFSHLLETDLLRVRVRELRDVVDRFVLLEAAHTFQGQERAFLFKEAAASVADLLGEDHARHIVGSSSFDAVQVASFPSSDYLSFAAETYLRDSVFLSGALDDLPKGDVIVIISDVDEVPSRAAAMAMKFCRGYSLPLAFETRSFNYNLGWGHQWRLVQARAILLSQLSPQFLPSDVRSFPHPSASNVSTFLGAGWHFTNFGGVDMILQKMNTFSHSEYKGTFKANPERLRRFISLGLDVFREEDDQLEMKCVRSPPASELHLPLLLHEDSELLKKWSGG